MLPALAVALPAPAAPEMHAPPRQPAAYPFADLLRQNQTTAAPSPATCAPPVAETASDDCGSSSETENARPTDAQRERKLAQRAPAHRPARITDEAAAHPAAASTGERSATTDDPPGGVPTDPSVSAWLADWRPLPPEPATAAGDAVVGETAVDQDRTVAGTGHAKRAGVLADAGDDARKAVVDDRSDTQRFALPTAGDPLAQAASASDSATKAIDKSIAMEASAASTPALPALAALSTPGTNGAPSAASVVAGVPTPFGSPDFAAAFGLQVSLLARDGHHRAELHLNPAELGPVSVQIVVDGTQARIDFGAHVASTRQAIEAGLPELASALRDAGLTLHGGGVSSHAGSHGGERGERDGAGAGDRLQPADDTAQARTQRVWRAAPGGVDLYA